jgi:hypothetical protein
MNELKIASELNALLRKIEQQRLIHADRDDEGHKGAEYAYSIVIREIGKIADSILAEGVG